MKQLWAPWRMCYIQGEKGKGCIFCQKPSERKDEENLIVCRRRQAFVVMNKFPYNNGHLMVVPKRHCVDLEELDAAESREVFRLLRASIRVLKDTFHPHGFNIGINLGRAGGAGEEHVHVHIVPRWNGDTNFMPVFGETKIIPEYLNETYPRLHAAFQEFFARKKKK